MGKAEEIGDWLRTEIRSGRLEVGARAPSGGGLARRFGVNKNTANKALTLLAAEGLLERGVRGAGTSVRGRLGFQKPIVYIGSGTHPFYAQVVDGVQRAALGRDRLMVLASPPPDTRRELVTQLAEMGIPGLLAASSGHLPDTPGMPTIHIDLEYGRQPRYLVSSDNEGGARLATEELLRLGHRELVMVAYRTSSRRGEGFVAALRAAGVPDPERRLLLCEDTRNLTARLVNEILMRFPDLTGVVTGSDDLALALIGVLRNLGLEVPERISVTGFGNLPHVSELFNLTSVEQHGFDLGYFSANRLLDMIEGKFAADSFHELLPCELVRRQSIRRLN